MRAQVHDPGHVVPEEVGKDCNRTGDDNGHARPTVEKRERAAEGPVQEVIFPAGRRKGGRKLRVAERANDSEDTACDPSPDDHRFAAEGSGDDRRCAENAGADDEPDDDRDRIRHAKRGARLSRLLRGSRAHRVTAALVTPSPPMRISPREVCLARNGITRWRIPTPPTVTLPSIVSPLTEPRKR